MVAPKLQTQDFTRYCCRRTLLAKVSVKILRTRCREQGITHENRFCIQSNEDYVDYLLLEDQAIYMNFFDWMFKTSREKLLQSYDEYWRRLCQYFELFAHRRVNEDVHKQMRRV